MFTTDTMLVQNALYCKNQSYAKNARNVLNVYMERSDPNNKIIKKENLNNHQASSMNHVLRLRE